MRPASKGRKKHDFKDDFREFFSVMIVDTRARFSVERGGSKAKVFFGSGLGKIPVPHVSVTRVVLLPLPCSNTQLLKDPARSAHIKQTLVRGF